MPSRLRLRTVFFTTLLLAAPAVRTCAADSAAPAAPAAAPAASITEEFKPIFESINAKLKAGQSTEADLLAEITAIDALLARFAATKTDEVAYVTFMKARLYLEVLADADKGIALLKDIQANFPESSIGKQITGIVAEIEKQRAAEHQLDPGQPFPPFAEQDLAGQPLALADFKGKVVLIDFWATWCGPCVSELPNVTAAYAKYHARGFEIIGISLDKDRDRLTAFLKENQMTWAQYFDGLGWQSKLGQLYGISSIPATFLLDGEGRIIARDLRGDELDQKLAELLK